MPKRDNRTAVLEKIIRREILEVKIGSLLNCGNPVCPIILPAKSSHYNPSAIQFSPELADSLADIRENYFNDHLGVGSRMFFESLAQDGVEIGYNHPEIDPLENSGMHRTNNPGFSYH